MNFHAPAEMYTGRQFSGGRVQPYRRFGTLVEAVRYAVEQQPAALLCTTIETDDLRLHSKEIQAVYNTPDYRTAARAASRRSGHG